MNAFNLTQIAKDSGFQDRVRFYMVEKALLVSSNNPTNQDLRLVQKILDGQEPVAVWALAAVTNPTIAAGTYTQPDGSDIVDSDLQYQIHTQWIHFLV